MPLEQSRRMWLLLAKIKRLMGEVERTEPGHGLGRDLHHRAQTLTEEMRALWPKWEAEAEKAGVGRDKIDTAKNEMGLLQDLLGGASGAS